MNRKKYLTSSISMIIMLFLVVLYQIAKISRLSFLEQSSTFNDLSFIFVSILIVILISLFVYYIPFVIIFEVHIAFTINISPQAYMPLQNIKTKYSFKPISRRYLRLNVIRC